MLYVCQWDVSSAYQHRTILWLIYSRMSFKYRAVLWSTPDVQIYLSSDLINIKLILASTILHHWIDWCFHTQERRSAWTCMLYLLATNYLLYKNRYWIWVAALNEWYIPSRRHSESEYLHQRYCYNTWRNRKNQFSSQDIVKGYNNVHQSLIITDEEL